MIIKPIILARLVLFAKRAITKEGFPKTLQLLDGNGMGDEFSNALDQILSVVVPLCTIKKM